LVISFITVNKFRPACSFYFFSTASVAVIFVFFFLQGPFSPRLRGALGGIYSNPNDLAFAIVLSLPFCIAFMLKAQTIPRKAAWAFAMLVMAAAIFSTASRGGFITLLVVAPVCLWHFAIKKQRIHLIIAAVLILTVVGVAGGGRL